MGIFLYQILYAILSRFIHEILCLILRVRLLHIISYIRHILLSRNITTSILLATWLSTRVSAEVVTSIRSLGFIVVAITDGVTPVKVILPDGASPHNYSLRPSDILRIQHADLLVWVGPELETFLNGPSATINTTKQIIISRLPTVKPLLLKANDEPNNHKTAVVSSKTFSYNENQSHNQYALPKVNTPMTEDDHPIMADNQYQGKYNMHLWLSPEIAKLTAQAIHERLSILMPNKKQQLDNNLKQFNLLLAKNDKNIAAILAPISNKGYYVFHDAYKYFEKYYGLIPLGYFTLNPEIQPGAQILHKIRTQSIEHKATCIFTEPQFRPAVVNAVARGTTVQIGILDPLGNGIALYKDSYVQFLTQLSMQYVSCLEKKK